MNMPMQFGPYVNPHQDPQLPQSSVMPLSEFRAANRNGQFPNMQMSSQNYKNSGDDSTPGRL